MKYIRLGKTDLMVSRSSFGALPIQRTGQTEVTKIINTAVDAGVNFFDTARQYTDSESKLGVALSEKREKVVLATKSMATTKDQFLKDLEVSLRELKTDYVDIMQLHNPKVFPDQDDPNSTIAGLDYAKKAGMIRFAGLTSHRRDVATDAIHTGIFDTIQFPLSMISCEKDWDIAKLCRNLDIGVIAMKAMSGGLITNAKAAFVYMRQFDYVVPIWGIQHLHELEEILGFENSEPIMYEEIEAQILSDKKELSGDFCRACGYCLPCPAGIDIPWAARIKYLLKRMPLEPLLAPEWQEKMKKVDDCIDCGNCKSRCPYGLDAPVLLKKMQHEYTNFIASRRG